MDRLEYAIYRMAHDFGGGVTALAQRINVRPGTLITKQFESGRKLAKTHQNVLVFCKGDWKKAAARCAAGIGDA